jgi:hypothetical protein
MGQRSRKAAAEAGKRITRPTDSDPPRRDRTPKYATRPSLLPDGPLTIRWEDLPASAKDLGDGMYELSDGMLVYLDESGT